MKINTSLDFRSFINELDLKYSSTKEKEFLYNMFKYMDKELYIIDLEKRKVILTSQTFSLDTDWISNIDKTTLYELYIKTYLNTNEDSIVLTFNTLENLKKVEEFITDNFKFLNKEE
jgi:hypothetical protein